MSDRWMVARAALAAVGMLVINCARNRHDYEAAWCRRAYWGASSATDSGRVDRLSAPGGARISCVSLRRAGRTAAPEPLVVGPARLKDEGEKVRGLVQQLMRAVAARDSVQIRSLVINDSVAARYFQASADSAGWKRFAAAQWHLVEISSRTADTLFPWYAARGAQLGCILQDNHEFRVGFVAVRYPPTWRIGLMYPEPRAC